MPASKDEFDILLNNYVASVSRKTLRKAGLDPSRFSDGDLASLEQYHAARSLLLAEREAPEFPGVTAPSQQVTHRGKELGSDEHLEPIGPKQSSEPAEPNPTPTQLDPPVVDSPAPPAIHPKAAHGAGRETSGPADIQTTKQVDHATKPFFAWPRRVFVIALVLALILALAYHTLLPYLLAAV